MTALEWFFCTVLVSLALGSLACIMNEIALWKDDKNE